MSLYDDVIYLSLLVFSIAVGTFLRRITDLKWRKWISSAIGLSVVFLVTNSVEFPPKSEAKV